MLTILIFSLLLAIILSQIIIKNYINIQNYSSSKSSLEESSSKSSSKSSVEESSLETSSHVNGICYFDIDDTLTTAVDDVDEIIKECLDNNFAVGIITASARTLSDICVNKPKWMSNILCKKFINTRGKLFNSLIVIDGNNNIFPDNYPYNKSYGYIKGFNMVNCRNKNYPYIPNNRLILFDDNPNVLKGVKDYNSELEVQCSNRRCGGQELSLKLVKNKIKKILEFS